MRKQGYLWLLLSIVLVAAGCTSSQKLLEKGRYDKAIDKSAKKLRKDPSDSEELAVLKEAYRKANRFDKERISFLQKEQRNQNWLEIYHLYSQLDYRQDVIKGLPTPLQSEFTLVNYDDELIRAKKAAADAMYQEGLTYLERGDREAARMAYEKFMRAKEIYPNYKDVDRMLEEARYMGTNLVVFQIENNSEKVLPRNFSDELHKIGLGDLNSQWVHYDSYPDSSTQYDFTVVMNIKQIEVSPETIEKRSYTETKEIQDGTRYVLDQNGNVKKDSLGNDIKMPNMVKISAEVTESVQHKKAIVAGSIDYYDLRNNQLVKTEKVSVDAVFEHYSATAAGDERALSKESRAMISNSPAPFPSDKAMLMDAADLLKRNVKSIVYDNRELLE